VEGSETVLDIDMLVTAIGQGPDVSFKGNGKRMAELATTRWDTIDSANPETLQTNIPYIFTGGDSATGASLVVEGIGGGRRAARSIHQYLTGQSVEPVPNSLFKKNIEGTIFDSVDGVIKQQRAEMPELPVEERIKTFDETDLVLQEEDSLREASRCMDCCRICYNKDKNAA
jgi:NADPH-dependent glutamate synthase beta subunit-like oxidoreductase